MNTVAGSTDWWTLAVIVGPLSLRAMNSALNMRGPNRSYLPSLDNRATRKSFRTLPSAAWTSMIESAREGPA